MNQAEASPPYTFRCELCRDRGWVYSDPDDIWSRMKPCECARDTRMEEAWAAANIPARFQSERFGTWQTPTSAHENVVSYIRRWAKQGAGVRPGLFLSGPPGTGKTHMAVACLRHLLATSFKGKGDGLSGSFVEWQSWIQDLKLSWDRDSDVSQAEVIGRTLADVVVFDEMCSGPRMTELQSEQMEVLLQRIYNEQRRLIVVSNYMPPGLGDEIKLPNGELVPKAHCIDKNGRLGKRMCSRLVEMCEPVMFWGIRDWRERAAS